jgi:hypothetical protein
MATLREYFFTEFRTGSTHFDYTVTLQGHPAVTVIARVHFDFTSYARYVSYFIPDGQYTSELAAYLTQNPTPVLDEVANSVEMTLGHPAVYGPSLNGNLLPFSGRVFLYVDQSLSADDKTGLTTAAASIGIQLQIKDREYSDFQTAHEEPGAFISHDSRDKDPFVRELASKLRSMMCPVWYDEYSLRVGQSLRESIDKGLSEATKCILVLSKNFLANPGWTKAEFNAIMNKHISGGSSVILPIWLDVSREEVATYSLLLTDIVALTPTIGMDELAKKLFVEINPGR